MNAIDTLTYKSLRRSLLQADPYKAFQDRGKGGSRNRAVRSRANAYADRRTPAIPSVYRISTHHHTNKTLVAHCGFDSRTARKDTVVDAAAVRRRREDLRGEGSRADVEDYVAGPVPCAAGDCHSVRGSILIDRIGAVELSRDTDGPCSANHMKVSRTAAEVAR